MREVHGGSRDRGGKFVLKFKLMYIKRKLLPSVYIYEYEI